MEIYLFETHSQVTLGGAKQVVEVRMSKQSTFKARLQSARLD